MADFIYYVTSFATVLGLPAVLVALIVFLAKPKLLNKHPRINNPVSRKKIAAVGLVSIFVAMMTFGSVLAATEPASVKQARVEQEAAAAKAEKETQAKKAADEEAKRQEAEAAKPVIKTQTGTEPVPFESIEQPDPAMPKGQKRVAIQGVNGERTITIEVTYVKDVETARKEIKNEITKAPVTQVTKVGTYVAPAPTPVPTPSTSGQTSGVRTGAICNDGSHSNATGRGACSHHGGVAYWLYN